MPGTIVPVLGMHRSGTSALAGALHTGGIAMGMERHFKPPPMPQNPRGFYEDYRFTRVNDRICRKNGYRVKSWEVPPPIVDDSFPLLGRRLLLLSSNVRRFTSWGWKDPRTCLTFGFWISSLRLLGRLSDVHVVFGFRDPLAVAESLRRRNDIGLQRALDLWHAYNGLALRALEASGASASFVEFSDLLGDPLGVLRELAGPLPGLDPEAGARFVEPELDHSSSLPGGEPRDERTPEHPALELFEVLRGRSR